MWGAPQTKTKVLIQNLTFVSNLEMLPVSMMSMRNMNIQYYVAEAFQNFDLGWSFMPTNHSQKQAAHWAVDVTAQMVPCWLGSWLNCTFRLVLGQWNQLTFQLIQLDITGVQRLNVAHSGDIQLSEGKITGVSCIWKPESSLHLISPFNWITTESWLRWWYTVGWAISSPSDELV